MLKATHRDTEIEKEKKDRMEANGILTSEIIRCAIEVHKTCGPGLLENVYKQCLIYELQNEGFSLESEKVFTYTYKESGVKFDFRVDLIVENSVIVELKSVSAVNSLHGAQLLTYMRLSGIKTGLLINFNVPYLKDGIQRFVI